MIRASLVLATAVSLVGCSNPELEAKVAELEKKVEALEKGGGTATAAAANRPAAAASEEETEAIELYKQANQAFQSGDVDKAKSLINDIIEKYPNTRARPAAERLLEQASLIGKAISKLEVDTWISANQADLDDGKATLLVFWEVWCPHCQREVPKLEATYNKYKDKGLNLIGLTKVNRGKTVDDVKAFMAEKNVTYPVAKETGSMSEFFNVSGVPAAAVVKGGKVIWRGHPATLTDEMLEGWL